MFIKMRNQTQREEDERVFHVSKEERASSKVNVNRNAF